MTPLGCSLGLQITQGRDNADKYGRSRSCVALPFKTALIGGLLFPHDTRQSAPPQGNHHKATITCPPSVVCIPDKTVPTLKKSPNLPTSTQKCTVSILASSAIPNLQHLSFHSIRTRNVTFPFLQVNSLRRPASDPARCCGRQGRNGKTCPSCVHLQVLRIFIQQ